MSNLVERLKKLDMPDASIERIQKSIERMRLRDDETFVDLIIELEWYLMSFQAVTSDVKKAAEVSLESSEKRSKDAVNKLVSSVATELAKETTKALEDAQRINRWRALVFGSAIVMFATTLGMSLGIAVEGTLPSYFSGAGKSDDLMVNFLLGALNAPSYITWGIVVFSISIGMLVDRWAGGYKAKKCFP